MRTHKILTGLVFGKWHVGVRVEGISPVTYSCTCACGGIHNVAQKTLLNGMSTQCRVCASKQPRPGAKKVICKRGHNIIVEGTTAPSSGCKLCKWIRYIESKYGIGLDEYLALYKAQEGKCAICAQPLLLNDLIITHYALEPQTEEHRRAEIDHKHIPNKVKPQPPRKSTVRGLLCGGRYAGCNAKLGHVDNAVWLQAAANYLLNPPAQNVLAEYGRRLREGGLNG
jgi:hypothetical protein